MANALGVTVRFLAYCIKFTTQKWTFTNFLTPNALVFGTPVETFVWWELFFLSCCILNSRREHLPLNWGYKYQNNLQNRYWFNVSVENHSHPPCYFKRERISVDSKSISGTSFEIKASCVLFDKEEFDCLFNIVSFWSQ